MRGTTTALLIGCLLLPAPALSRGRPLTDAQLEDIAAVPDDPESSGQSGQVGPAGLGEPSIASVAAQHELERWPLVIFVTPYYGGPGVVPLELLFRGTPILPSPPTYFPPPFGFR